MDYPGHYMRRIKSVALTVPCIIGPYTSLNCTLRLLEHSFRTKATVSQTGSGYLKTDENDDRFTTVNVPISAIAVSTGQNDSGVFELNFRDDRYIPFEGAGAISRWRIDLPKNFRQFDYNTISDVVMHVRYTSVDGGDNLQRAAAGAVSAYVAHPTTGATNRVVPLDTLYDRLPIVVRNWQVDKVGITDAYLVSSVALSSPSLSIRSSTDTPFAKSAPVGELQMYAAHDLGAQLSNVKSLTIGDVTTQISSLWLVVRYVLQGS